MHGLPRILIVAAAVLALAACSAVRLSYNNADTLLRYMAWDYFDLDSGQSEHMQAAIARLHRWHRANEIPDYAALAAEAGKRVERGVTREDVAWAIANLRSRIRRVTARGAQDAAPILATLGPAQIAALEHKFAEKNEKYAKEYLSNDERKRHKAQLDRTLDRFHDFLGELTGEQRTKVDRFVAEHARYVELRFEDRQRWQHEVVALLRRYRQPEELGAHLSDLLLHPETRRAEEFAREERRWEEDLAALLVDLNGTLTAKQRARAVKRLERYAEDFGALAMRSKEGA